MDIRYTLELFPTEDNWEAYVAWLGGTDIQRNNDNAGVDLYCAYDTNLGLDSKTGEKLGASDQHAVRLLDMGVKARMIRHCGFPNWKSETCHYWLAPRSSIWKNGVTQANSIGIIDRTYRGNIMGAVIPIKTDVVIQKGNRLFQILAPDMGHISRVVLKPLSELDETGRGEGGFGSTGR